MQLLWIVVAGGLGSGSRYLIGTWAVERIGAGFPYGTIIINLTGCFAIGFVMQMASVSAWSPEIRAAVTAGFLGGFTTYSSFNQETLTLFASGRPGAAAVNVAITLAGGLAAGWLGLALARQIVG
ncbi:MAG: fluoride efflux transporter CrcB [Vicinamibacterales bacterium]|jgi:CrcB protein